MHEVTRSGLDHVAAITTLLQRARSAHPTHGSFDAAEIQFWWIVPRSTDTFDQLFWLGDDGQPAAAFFVGDFGDGSSLTYEAPTAIAAFLPDPDPGFVAHVVERGLEHLEANGIENVETEVGRDDAVLRDVLTGHGLEIRSEGLNEAWLDAADRVAVSPLADGYRLCTRADVADRPHHLDRPNRPDAEARLRQLSLYSPDFDLFVLAPDDSVAGYGLAWNDPVTGVGVIEPMRTADEHQQLGIARHILTAAVDRLAAAGARRLKIAYASDNPGASRLYPDVGFTPFRMTDVFSR